MKNTDSVKDELFAVVPQALLRSTQFSPIEKVVIGYLFGKYQTKRDDGLLYDFSVERIAYGSGISLTRCKRTVKQLEASKVLCRYGTLQFSKYKPTTVFIFNKSAFDILLKSKSTVALDIANENGPIEVFEVETKSISKSKSKSTVAHHKEEYQKEEYINNFTLHCETGKESQPSAIEENTEVRVPRIGGQRIG